MHTGHAVWHVFPWTGPAKLIIKNLDWHSWFTVYWTHKGIMIDQTETQTLLKTNISWHSSMSKFFTTSQILGLNPVHLRTNPAGARSSSLIREWPVGYLFRALWYDVVVLTGPSSGRWSGTLVQLDEGSGKISALFLKGPFKQKKVSGVSDRSSNHKSHLIPTACILLSHDLTPTAFWKTFFAI